MKHNKVSVEAGIPGWSRAAIDVLLETATGYDGVLTTSEFAHAVQERAGAWANVTSQTWIRKVLKVVTLKCEKEGWPYLASLVVRPSDGRPGPWYMDVLAITGPGASTDERTHAAIQRLECYKYFEADVPLEAVPNVEALRSRRTVVRIAPQGRPARTRRGAPAPRVPKAPPAPKAAPAPAPVCPTCFMELPRTGVCLECG